MAVDDTIRERVETMVAGPPVHYCQYSLEKAREYIVRHGHLAAAEAERLMAAFEQTAHPQPCDEGEYHFYG